MIALLVNLWPDPLPAAPRTILAIEYRPQMRPARIAPPNLRTPAIDQAPLMQLVDVLIDRERQ